MNLRLEIELKDNIEDMDFFEICRLAHIISALKYTHENIKADYDLIVIYAKKIGEFLTQKILNQLPENTAIKEIVIGDRYPFIHFKFENEHLILETDEPILLDQLFLKDNSYRINDFYLIGLMLRIADSQLDKTFKKAIQKEIDKISKHFNLKRR